MSVLVFFTSTTGLFVRRSLSSTIYTLDVNYRGVLMDSPILRLQRKQARG